MVRRSHDPRPPLPNGPIDDLPNVDGLVPKERGTPSRLKKQISVFLPADDWRLVRHEAARRGLFKTELLLEWLEPHLKRLRKQQVD